MDKIRKLVIKTFKDFGFKIEIKTNLKIAEFLDVTLNLNKGTYSPFKKPKIKHYISILYQTAHHK